MIPEHLFIHHSLTQDGKTVSMNAIRKYHTVELGWRDIGYHFIIELVNEEYEIFVGRAMNDSGAHCRQDGMNHKSLGICCVGNFDKDSPPEELWDLCVRLTKSLMAVFNIPSNRVYGHREYASYKSCPGKKWNMDLFRAELGGI